MDHEGQFDSIQELVRWVRKVYCDVEDPCVEGAVKEILLPPGEPSYEAVTFYFRINHGFAGVFRYEEEVNEKIYRGYGIDEEHISDVENNFLRHPFPFRSGERLQIRTPAMEKPIYGYMDSECDCCGSWYHWFHVEEEGGGTGQKYDLDLDLSYSSPDLGIHSTLDWITRVEDDGEGLDKPGGK